MPGNDPITANGEASQDDGDENSRHGALSALLCDGEINNVAIDTPDELSTEDIQKALPGIFERAAEIIDATPKGRPKKGVKYKPKVSHTLKLDPEVLDWAKSKNSTNPNVQMNAILRAVMEADIASPQI